MARDLKLGMTITSRDQASGTNRKVMQDAERQAKRASETSQRAARDAGRVQERVNRQTEESQARLARSREQIGIRTEARIRQEIQRTQAAYDRLAQSGRLSAQEQGRAYDQMRNKVSGLRREMSGLEQQERRANRGMNAGSMILRGGQMLMAGGRLAAGAAAGGYAIAQPTRRVMTYEQRLAYMANTAFSDRDKAGRLRGMGELKGAVDHAVDIGGGTRASAAETLDAMLASGAMSQKDAFKLLPSLQQAATATGAAPSDLAQIAISGMQTFGFKAEDIPKALDMATKAGQMGGFELKDMAHWLPSMMAYAKNAGMSGLKDFGSLLTAAQASRITAGNADTAGNNLTNWLAKLVSPDTQLRASKIPIDARHSIDLQGTISKDAGRGINALDSFVGIIGKVMSNDKGFQAMQARLRDPKLQKGERSRLMEKQTDILQGSIISQLLPDRQGILALVGYMNNPKFRKNIDASYATAAGTNQANYDVIAETDAFKVQSAMNVVQSAEYDAFKRVSDTVGDLAKKLADLAREYPGMTAAVVGAAEALRALSLAAGSWMLIGALRGRSMAAAGAAGAAGAGIGLGEAAAAGTAGAAGGSRVLGRLAKVGGTAAVLGMGSYELYKLYNSGAPSDQKTVAASGVAGGAAGSLAGMYAGAAAGSLLGPVGTFAGGLIGGIGGNYLGSELAERLATTFYFAKQPKYEPAPAPVMDPQDFQARLGGGTMGSIPIHVTVDVQNGNITASVLDAMNRNAWRH